MKKTLVLLSVILIIVSLTGCGGIKLAEGQEMYILNSDGTMDWQGLLEGGEFAQGMGFDYDDDEKVIINTVNEYLNKNSISGEVKNVKKVKGYVLIDVRFISPGDIMAYDMTMTLEKFANDYYGGMTAMADQEIFYLYKNASRVSSNDLIKYAGHKFLTVFDSSGKGSYFKVPGKIMIVHSESEYKKVNNDTIFIEGDGYGAVVYKEN